MGKLIVDGFEPYTGKLPNFSEGTFEFNTDQIVCGYCNKKVGIVIGPYINHDGKAVMVCSECYKDKIEK